MLRQMNHYCIREGLFNYDKHDSDITCVFGNITPDEWLDYIVKDGEGIPQMGKEDGMPDCVIKAAWNDYQNILENKGEALEIISATMNEIEQNWRKSKMFDHHRQN